MLINMTRLLRPPCLYLESFRPNVSDSMHEYKSIAKKDLFSHATVANLQHKKADRLAEAVMCCGCLILQTNKEGSISVRSHSFLNVHVIQKIKLGCSTS